MKKIANKLMVMLLITVMLVGCGKEMLVSDLSVSTLEYEFIDNLNESGLTEIETDYGFDFECKTDYMGGEIYIGGQANSEKKIANIEMTISECVDIDFFEDFTFDQFSDIYGNVDSMTQGEICTLYFILSASNLICILNGNDFNDDGEISKNTKFLLSLNEEKKHLFGWEYSLSVNKSAEKITLTAEYIGEE